MSDITIYIETDLGKCFQITVNVFDTIEQGKRQYRNVSGSNVYNLIWNYNTVVLNNQKTFDFYGIEDGATILSNEILLG